MCACEICTEEGEAADKARRLLHQHLTDSQRRQLHRGHIVLKGNATGDRYRLDFFGDVRRIRDEHAFCSSVFEGVHPNGGNYAIPRADQILAKKILIEADERLFLKTANDLSE